MADNELSLVALGEEHLASIAVIEQACFADPWSKESLSILTRDGGFGVVAIADGRAVAYGGMTWVLDEGSVTNIATLPEWRGRGIGHRVARALLDEARKRKIGAVFLEVRVSNAPALAVYRKEGFVECGRRKGFYRHPTEDAILMVWRDEMKEE